MRIVLAGVVLAACGSSAPAPTCTDALGAAAQKLGGGSNDKELTTLIGACEQHAWSPHARACLKTARDAEAIAGCLPMKVTYPAPTVELAELVQRATAANGKPKALAFYDARSPIGVALAGFFEPLEIAVEYIDAPTASTYHASAGDVVIVAGTKHHRFAIARTKLDLEDLDRQVMMALVDLSRSKRVVYVHAGADHPRKYMALDKQLTELNLEKRDAKGATPGPDDVMLVLGALPTDDTEAVAAYLGKGGRALVTFDRNAPAMPAIETVLGVKPSKGVLTDDTTYLKQRGTDADRRFVLTNDFSAHPTTTSLARMSDKGLLIVQASALEEISGAVSKRTSVIRTKPTAWLDLVDNFKFDGNEKRDRFVVAYAIEDRDMRAFVTSDPQMFADVAVAAGTGTVVTMTSGPLIGDVIKWLADEEDFVPIPRAAAIDRTPTPTELDAKSLYEWVERKRPSLVPRP